MEPRLRTVLGTMAVLAVLLTVGMAYFGARAAWSTGLGGALAVANFYVLGRTVRAFLNGEGGLWGLFAFLKILFFFGGFWFVLQTGKVLPLAFLAGFSVIPLGIVLGSLSRAPGEA